MNRHRCLKAALVWFGVGIALLLLLALPCRLQVCAMPECAIGLHPDVGASWFLNHKSQLLKEAPFGEPHAQSTQPTNRLKQPLRQLPELSTRGLAWWRFARSFSLQLSLVLSAVADLSPPPYLCGCRHVHGPHRGPHERGQHARTGAGHALHAIRGMLKGSAPMLMLFVGGNESLRR